MYLQFILLRVISSKIWGDPGDRDTGWVRLEQGCGVLYECTDSSGKFWLRTLEKFFNELDSGVDVAISG